jgi:hypothetical protein
MKNGSLIISYTSFAEDFRQNGKALTSAPKLLEQSGKRPHLSYLDSAEYLIIEKLYQ